MEDPIECEDPRRGCKRIRDDIQLLSEFYHCAKGVKAGRLPFLMVE